MSAESAGPSRAIGDFRPNYVGRFAPSPTGALHLGSLVAALGSFLDARKAGGRWLLRMEDLDTPRVIPGCSDEMLRTLEAFGLHWDGEVEFQSRRTARYAESLESLRAAGLTFECSCSRRELAGLGETGYPGTCRNARQVVVQQQHDSGSIPTKLCHGATGSRATVSTSWERYGIPSSAVGMGSLPTNSPSSSTTRRRVLARSSGAPTCCRAPPGRSCSSEP